MLCSFQLDYVYVYKTSPRVELYLDDALRYLMPLIMGKCSARLQIYQICAISEDTNRRSLKWNAAAVLMSMKTTAPK